MFFCPCVYLSFVFFFIVIFLHYAPLSLCSFVIMFFHHCVHLSLCLSSFDIVVKNMEKIMQLGCLFRKEYKYSIISCKSSLWEYYSNGCRSRNIQVLEKISWKYPFTAQAKKLVLFRVKGSPWWLEVCVPCVE